MEKENIARNLRNLMIRNGYNQKEFASTIGVSEQAVSFWCNGEKFPRIDRIQKIADFFGVSVNDLLGNPTDKVDYVVKNSEYTILIEDKVGSLECIGGCGNQTAAW